MKKICPKNDFGSVYIERLHFYLNLTKRLSVKKTSKGLFNDVQ